MAADAARSGERGRGLGAAGTASGGAPAAADTAGAGLAGVTPAAVSAPAAPPASPAPSVAAGARRAGGHRAHPAASRGAGHRRGGPRRPADRPRRRRQDHRGPALGQHPARTDRAREPGRRPGVGLLRLRGPPGRLERALRGPVPARPPHLWLRRTQLPGERHLLHPGRRRVPRPARGRPRRLEAARGPHAAAGGAAARPGDRPGAQRGPFRQPPALRRGSRADPRPDGRLVRLRPADHRQLHLDVEGTARALDEALARALAAPGGWPG